MKRHQNENMIFHIYEFEIWEKRLWNLKCDIFNKVRRQDNRSSRISLLTAKSKNIRYQAIIMKVKQCLNQKTLCNYGHRKRWISNIVNPTRVISPKGNNPSGVDNFGYSPIQRAVTVSLYRTNSWNILFNIWIVKVLFHQGYSLDVVIFEGYYTVE